MRSVRTSVSVSAVVALLVMAPSVCFAMISIEVVSRERAKKLGLEVRANAACPDTLTTQTEK